MRFHSVNRTNVAEQMYENVENLHFVKKMKIKINKENSDKFFFSLWLTNKKGDFLLFICETN